MSTDICFTHVNQKEVRERVGLSFRDYLLHFRFLCMYAKESEPEARSHRKTLAYMTKILPPRWKAKYHAVAPWSVISTLLWGSYPAELMATVSKDRTLHLVEPLTCLTTCVPSLCLHDLFLSSFCPSVIDCVWLLRVVRISAHYHLVDWRKKWVSGLNWALLTTETGFLSFPIMAGPFLVKYSKSTHL